MNMYMDSYSLVVVLLFSHKRCIANISMRCKCQQPTLFIERYIERVYNLMQDLLIDRLAPGDFLQVFISIRHIIFTHHHLYRFS